MKKVSPIWKGPLVLLVVAALDALLTAVSGGSRLTQGLPCAAGPGLCYSALVNAGPLINTKHFDGGPSLSDDGLTLFFGSARQNRLGELDEDIYVASREATTAAFGSPQNLGPMVNALGFGDYSPELSPDGLTLYFSSSRPGGLGEADLYVTTRLSVDAPWRTAQNLGPSVNSPRFEGQPSISADGKTLFWDSTRPDGNGDFDIWMATRDTVAMSFRPAVNVGPTVNTVGPEFGPAISRDGTRLFFSSGRPGNKGKVDIWAVERKTASASWSAPINIETLNSPFFQAMPTFDGNGTEVCVMAIRPDGLGELDIWCARRLR